ncbi:cation:proton antiporter [Halocalculus aciditolerans]|uniref:Transporter n=1 Tax=Halocalculus aciditolerans TaxID=1383812 RepID=A0A830FHP5_9EURY|nr:cation:proton antiporter [Halocalculus aciditolerans]GGL56318.1 transporter [Halocalculus aciditolerans]
MAAFSLLEVGIALLAIALAGALARRFGQSVIPAYIAAGIIVGPHVPTNLFGVSLRLVEHTAFIDTIAELGVVLLLFFLGLEFHVETLFSNTRRVLGIGALDFAVNAAVGVAIGLLFGFGVTGTVLLVGIVYISSSAIITKSLTEAGWLANPDAEVILSTLVVEDLLIAVYLAVVSAVVIGGGTLSEAAVTVGQSFVFLAVLAAAASLGTKQVERVFDINSDELFVLHVFGVLVVVAALALSLGVSEAVAAFFVGTAFTGTSLVERIETALTPLRDVFAAVFFFSIGLVTDLLVVADVAVLLAVAVLLTTASKLVSGVASGRLYGLSDRRSVRVGLGLVARGEFSLIIATLAATSAVPEVRDLVPAFAAGYVLAMSLLGTLCIQYEPRIARAVGLADT